MSELVRHVLSLDPETTQRHRACVRPIAPQVVRAGAGRAALYELAHFSESFAAVIGEFDMPAPLGIASAPHAWLQWHYRIRGDVLLDCAGEDSVRVGASSAALRVAGGGASRGWVYCGADQCFLTLLMHPRLIEEISQSAAGADSQRRLLDLLGGASERTVRMQASSALIRAVNDVIRSPYEGQLRLVHLKAKVLEVFCISVQELQRRAEQRQPLVMLSQRDIARLGEVRAALMQHPTRWLTINQLSRQFALNQRKLKEGFKHLFGDTVFQFAQEQRMIQARRMIEEDAMPIGHVSAAIGYESHASFTAAFKRHFGYLPRDARVRGRIRRSSIAASQPAEADHYSRTSATVTV